MARQQHTLTDIDPVACEGTCAICGRVALRRRARGPVWRYACIVSDKRYKDSPRRNLPGRRKGQVPYQHLKGDCCGRCGFVPEAACQLDVHHRDGDRLNCDAGNLLTLCANCHRLITHCR